MNSLYTEMKENFDNKIFPILIFPLRVFILFSIVISTITAAIIFYPVFTLWLLLYWIIMFPIIIIVRYFKYTKIFEILFIIGLLPLFALNKFIQYMWYDYDFLLNA